MNAFQDLFARQKRYFATGATRTYAWRIEQLDRMARLVAENEAALQQAIAQDFKTASQEYIFETQACLGEVMFQKSMLKDWMAPTDAPVPRALATTGHRGNIYRDPYGVAFIIGPFNGPLLLLLRPAITALAAGNCCLLKLSDMAAYAYRRSSVRPDEKHHALLSGLSRERPRVGLAGLHRFLEYPPAFGASAVRTLGFDTSDPMPVGGLNA